MRRLIAPLALAIALGVAGPASATITVAKTAAETITVTSTAASPADTLGYRLTSGKLGIDRTAGESLAPGQGCTGNGNSVTCAVDYIPRLVILLGPGDDTITANPTLPVGMHVEIHGGPGRDTLRGADASNDLLFGDDGDDVLDGGFGDDKLDGGAGDDTLTADLGADSYRGGTGVDALSYATYTSPVRVTIGAGADDGAVGETDDVGGDIERVDGGTGEDTLIGSPGADLLYGGAGSDVLDGGAGADLLVGGADNDTIAARDGVADLISCGDGADAITTDQLDAADSCEAVQSASVVLGGGAASANGGAAGPGATTVDADGDGSPLGADCDDHDKAIHPGATEIPANGKDDNCDGIAASLLSPAFTLSTAQTAGAKATIFRKLALTGAPGGATVTVTCKAPKKAKGCPFATKSVKAHAGKVVSFATALKGAALPVGTVLELRTVAGNATAIRVERLTVRARKAPKRQTSCVNPVTAATLPAC